ncbi:hypothetical protein EYF80_058225 [Liparis tanakae]|uniref:Uncharacterized protein n=1 Tax=Liparis tanakae TaxID=230148 RepID=A0A4Z2ERS1_9TELE|nr:hypothetical protein EYF80_058225 [Liparis tanakae]
MHLDPNPPDTTIRVISVWKEDVLTSVATRPAVRRHTHANGCLQSRLDSGCHAAAMSWR